ncbi:8989_t:CDS:2 [Gigaspora margarita]|uniref:8989_t:CDS:1 n=1 Tax=Gigaspora margarita TaxID=4874 RepID=A0ABM8W1T8_GIGMA|nr:8989_t:CDS:2 [Gigaspora margarita]
MTTSATEQTTTSAATTTFESAVIFNIAFTTAGFIIFDLIRKKSKRIFEPRTYIIPEEKRSPQVPNGFLKWVKPTLMTPDEELIARVGLDGYMFLRVIRAFMRLFVAFTVIGIGIILPLNHVGQSDQPGLESFTIGNIKDNERLYAHVIACYLFTAAILYMMYHEYYTYIRLRHECLTTPEHRVSARATTILVLGVPSQLNNETDLKNLYNVFPGGVKRIWLNSEPTRLIDLTAKRMKALNKLENAETVFLEKYLKYLAKDGGSGQDVENGNKIPTSLRPTHKTIPLIGKKVDSIETYRDEINKLNEEINDQRTKTDTFKQLDSAFIQFNDFVGAQLAATSTIPRLTEISREDVIWENLKITNPSRLTFRVNKRYSFLKTTRGQTSSISNWFHSGCLTCYWLGTLDALSKFEGLIRHSDVMLSLQGKYFFFLLFNVLLVTTTVNGAAQAIPAIINNPTSIIKNLAENLPKASTFFLTYVLLSLSTASIEALQVGSLSSYLVTKKFLVKTPRQILHLETTLVYKDWGVTFPPHILIASIGIVYSVIQPLILPFTALHFALFYLAYRYNFLYIYDQIYETNGNLFVHAMEQFFWGIFIFQLTIIGLMFLNDAHIPGVLAVILFIITISTVLGMRAYFQHNPKAEFLPVNLMGVIDMKTNKVIANTDFTKSTSSVTEDEKVDQGSKNKQISENPLTDIDDEYTDPNVVHIKHGDIEKKRGVNAYTHPALIVANPLVWIPQDNTEMYKEEIKRCQDSGLNATSRGAKINEKYKVKVDITKAPNITDEFYVEEAESSDAMKRNTTNVID